MYISRFRLGNYKSFREPAALEFTQGFNIVAGQNNSGKTALLEALGLQFASNPHRSMTTVRARDTMPHPVSWADVAFTVPISEVKELLLSMGAGAIHQITQPVPGSEFANRVGFRDDSVDSARALLNAVFSNPELTFCLRLRVNGGNRSWAAADWPTFGLYQGHRPGGTCRTDGFQILPDGTPTPTGQVCQNDLDFGMQLAHAFERHVYRFTAERMNVGVSNHGTGSILLPNASNLPEVLNRLQGNAAEFRELNRRLNTIFPQVRCVSTNPVSNQQVEIRVWSHDPESRRDDLAVPLKECGTGIGQVLAILYVVMTSTRPQVVVIDEPQSFLYPGAARKLMDFLREYPQHQFIIATHSATIISAANPSTITLARFEDGETLLQQLDARAEKGIQATFVELGVRLADLFGADNILWVEGRTEEKCYPIIVEKMLGRQLMGTQILGVRETGDLDGRDARRVFEIYRRLAHGASLLPPAIGFILDQECKDDVAKDELRRLSEDRVRFVARRMYENYLLNPEAIAEVANSIDGFRAEPVTPGEVQTAIESKLNDPGYYCNRVHPSTAAEREARVDGGRVLKDIFSQLSETRVPYEKVRHGMMITEWLAEHAPNNLQDIAELLSDVLGAH